MYCPKCGTQNPDGAPSCQSCGTPFAPVTQSAGPGNYRVGEWVGQAWRLATAQIWPMVLLGLVGLLPGGILGSIVGAPISIAVGASVDDQMVAQLISWGLGGLAGWIVSILLVVQIQVGVGAVLLNYVRTQRMDLSLLGTGFNKWSECLMLGIWPGAVVFVAAAIPCLAILLLPLYVAATVWYGFGWIALSEPGMTQAQAADLGLRLVKLNFWQAVVLGLLGIGLALLGVLACCVGAFFAIPLFWLTMAIGYVELTRSQTTAA